jgi:serine/threonine-protein kinase
VVVGDLVSGKYRLLRALGTGGMGSVWAARNELTNRDFAIKFLKPEMARNREALQRFFNEARACGQIKHPAVVEVYDMGQAEDGTPYLVMELLEGEGLDQRIARSGVFRPGEAAACIAFVARGLEEAHVRGLVHRDLKPANLFFALDDRGEVAPKVLDFGVSKATSDVVDPDMIKTNTGAVLGSPAYMSPEQARGELDVDGRSDVWSLGVILYEMLVGRPPFDGPNYNALMVAILTQPHMPVAIADASLPTDLSDLVDQALEKDRQKRIGSARELADRLEELVQRITATPYPVLGARVAGRTASGRLRSVPPPADAAARGRSSGAGAGRDGWSHSGSHDRGRSHLAMWVSGGVLAAAIASIAIVAATRQRPPQVAVAARSAALMQVSLERARAAVSAALLDDRPPREEGLTIEPEALPPADADVRTSARSAPPPAVAPPASATSRPAPPRRPPPAPKKGPPRGGGIDDPGF